MRSRVLAAAATTHFIHDLSIRVRRRRLRGRRRRVGRVFLSWLNLNYDFIWGPRWPNRRDRFENHFYNTRSPLILLKTCSRRGRRNPPLLVHPLHVARKNSNNLLPSAA